MRTQNPNSDDVYENRIYLGLWANGIQEVPDEDGYGLTPYYLAAASQPTKPSSRRVALHLLVTDARRFQPHSDSWPSSQCRRGKRGLELR